MKIDIGDNLVHLAQLVVLGSVCCILAVWTKIDTAALLTAFIGVAGALTGVHLATMQYGNVSRLLPAALAASPRLPNPPPMS